MTSNIVSQERLKELLHYNPNTGEFTWNSGRQGVAEKSLSVAGAITERGYRRICIDGKKIMAHRLAWSYITGEFPPFDIDHIDGNRLNNRIVNLRTVNRLDNSRNSSIGKRNKSGVVGLSWDKVNNRWKSAITDRGKTINLGRFIQKWDAICARKSAEHLHNYHKNHGKQLTIGGYNE